MRGGRSRFAGACRLSGAGAVTVQTDRPEEVKMNFVDKVERRELISIQPVEPVAGLS